MSNNTKHVVMFVLGLAGLFVLGIFFISITKTSGPKNKGLQTQVSQTFNEESSREKSGYFRLSTPETSGISVGQTLLIEISLDTNGKDLTGYDALVSFDSENFEVQSAQSEIKGFEVYKKVEEGLIKLTGIKGPSSEEEAVFAGETAVKLALLPKKSGTYQIALLESKDKSKSKFVDSETNVYYPGLNSISVVVK